MLASVIRHELPLIAFTVCAPAGVGACWCATILAGIGIEQAVWVMATALVLTCIAMIASIVHLAKPLRAPTAIKNWKTSCLSREILLVAGFALLALLAALLLWFRGGWLASFVSVCASIEGVCLLIMVARAYRVSGQPGWNGADGLLEVFAIAFANGMFFGGSLAGFFGSIAAFGLTFKSSDLRRTRLTTLEDSPRVSECRASMQRTKKPRKVYLYLWVASAACHGVAYITGIWALSAIGFVVTLTSSFLMRACFYALATTARYMPPTRQAYWS